MRQRQHQQQQSQARPAAASRTARRATSSQVKSRRSHSSSNSRRRQQKTSGHCASTRWVGVRARSGLDTICTQTRVANAAAYTCQVSTSNSPTHSGIALWLGVWHMTAVVACSLHIHSRHVCVSLQHPAQSCVRLKRHLQLLLKLLVSSTTNTTMHMKLRLALPSPLFNPWAYRLCRVGLAACMCRTACRPSSCARPPRSRTRTALTAATTQLMYSSSTPGWSLARRMRARVCLLRGVLSRAV